MGAHNNRVEAKNQNIGEERQCSCPKTKKRKQFVCKFEGRCLENNIVYQATGDNFNYIGLTKGNLKDRISKPDFSFRSLDKEHKTRLSTKM